MPADDVIAALRRLGIGVLDRRDSRRDSPARAVSGGSISRTWRLETDRGPILLKLEPRNEAERLEAEAEGLEALRRDGAPAVPAVLACASAGGDAFLALEWIDFGPRSPDSEQRLGRALAHLHRHTADAFGWHRDNYIGRTPQPNGRMHGWLQFFRERRLAHQLGLARRNGIGRDVLARADELLERLDELLSGHLPAPSLLHGDLWGGNWGADSHGTPYVFDPAPYYGDREADIAMTRLFGGFGAAFYRAYDDAWPPAPGRDRRVDLYNLYHLLNHYNLFGAGYRSQVIERIDRVLRG